MALKYWLAMAASLPRVIAEYTLAHTQAGIIPNMESHKGRQAMARLENQANTPYGGKKAGAQRPLSPAAHKATLRRGGVGVTLV